MKNRKAVHFKALTGFIWLCLCAVLLFGTASPAFSEITGRMILSIKDNAEIMSRLKNGDEITISLYRLAGRTGDYLDPVWTFVNPRDFADLATEITDYELAVRTDGYPKNADGLLNNIAKVIADSDIEAAASGKFSRDGTVTFKDMQEGLYFFMMTAGPERVKIKSAIVPVPFVYKRAMHYDPIELTVKGEVIPRPPITPSPRPRPTPTPYIPPVNPNPPINPPVNPPQQNQNEIIIDDYDTPLGIAVEMNHVGDCYE